MANPLVNPIGVQHVCACLCDVDFILEATDAPASGPCYVRARGVPVRLYQYLHRLTQGGVIPQGWPSGVHPVLILVKTARTPERLSELSENEKCDLSCAAAVEEHGGDHDKRLTYLAKVLVAEDDPLKRDIVIEAVLG